VEIREQAEEDSSETDLAAEAPPGPLDPLVRGLLSYTNQVTLTPEQETPKPCTLDPLRRARS